jgi:cell wall-associated NlpC family hydrolase
VLVRFAGPAFAAPDQPSETNPPSCAVVKKAPAKANPKVQAPSKAKPQAPLRGKTTAASRAKSKSGTKAAVAAKTVAKAQAITAEIAPALPENLENEISKFFGISYRLGGDGPAGIDCSALVKKVYSDLFGISLPRSSSEQAGKPGQCRHDELKASLGGQNRCGQSRGMYHERALPACSAQKGLISSSTSC